MNDKKVLQINPELFTFSNNNKTKKSKPKEPKLDKIRVKNSVNKNPDTLRKQSLLKMIRKQQEDRYKRLNFNNNKPQNQSYSKPNNTDDINKFNTEFDKAVEYLDKLTKKNEMNVPKNTTLRKYPPVNASHNVVNEIQNLDITNPTNIHIPSNNNKVPQYGCLKGGNLPTYRNYMNKTEKTRPQIQIGNNIPLLSDINVSNIDTRPNISSTNIETRSSIPNISSTNIETQSSIPNNIIDNKINKGMKIMNDLKQQHSILNKIKNGGNHKKLKRKKTLKRTYRTGRSSVAPKVSVLVSNKTLRNRITTKGQLLKQTPIQEVKKVLIKQGLIRVGAITPNDILRKMYETVSLVCGEIQNHNPDTLLYNYINGTD